jgi:hypothetical protein
MVVPWIVSEKHVYAQAGPAPSGLKPVEPLWAELHVQGRIPGIFIGVLLGLIRGFLSILRRIFKVQKRGASIHGEY